MSAAGQPGGTATVALAATLTIQMFVSLAATAPAVLAPALAPDLGLTPKWLGLFVGILYTGTMIGSLACGGLIARWGAIRLSQVCVLACACGIAAIAVLPGAAAPLLIAIAFFMGLGYGPITPASSDVLARTTPPAQMALMFSLKQTGVPAGTALAGALMPVAALALDWRGALIAVALLGLVVALGAQPTRHRLDAQRRPAERFSLAGMVRPLKLVMRVPALRELSLIGFAFAAVQISMTSFLVLFLHETLEWSLVQSGLALTVATVSAILGRILWGLVADRTGRPRQVLIALGTLACLCGLALATSGPDWPVPLLLVLLVVYGATAIGWNGVQLAELARLSPPGTAGEVTGASGFVTYAGVVIGPPAFAGLTAVFGSYRAGFLMAALVSGTAAILLHRHRPEPPVGRLDS